jgi:hypothetical protein
VGATGKRESDAHHCCNTLGKEHPVPIGWDAWWALEPILNAVKEVNISYTFREYNADLSIVQVMA